MDAAHRPGPPRTAIHLLPYERMEAPYGDSELQRTMDVQLSSHTTPPNHLIAKATLVAVDREDPLRRSARNSDPYPRRLMLSDTRPSACFPYPATSSRLSSGTAKMFFAGMNSFSSSFSMPRRRHSRCGASGAKISTR